MYRYIIIQNSKEWNYVFTRILGTVHDVCCTLLLADTCVTHDRESFTVRLLDYIRRNEVHAYCDRQEQGKGTLRDKYMFEISVLYLISTTMWSQAFMSNSEDFQVQSCLLCILPPTLPVLVYTAYAWILALLHAEQEAIWFLLSGRAATRNVPILGVQAS